MAARQDDPTGRKATGRTARAGEDRSRTAGGSYGDQQSQYGTTAPQWQEPMPGHDEREEYGAGGEAFGSASGQGRYARKDQARRIERPEHPAWQPFGEPDANHPEEGRTGQARERSEDAHFRDWGDRAMRQHDEEYRAYREERQKKLDAEFEDWRKARHEKSGKPTPSKD